MRKSTITAVFFVSFSLFLWSCQKECSNTTSMPRSESRRYDYNSAVSGGKASGGATSIVSISWTGRLWGTKPKIINTGSSPIISLGHIIFYDKITTINMGNCATCHSAVPDAPVSPSQTSMPGNGFPTVNTRGGNNQFESSSVQAEHPTVGLEDGDKLIAKMTNTSYYPQLFQDAFGTSEITHERIAEALAQYMSARTEAHSSSDPRFLDPFK